MKRLENADDLRNRRDVMRRCCEAARATLDQIRAERAASKARRAALRARLTRRRQARAEAEAREATDELEGRYHK